MTTTLTATDPEDLLAAVPVLLGFHPEQSLVMLTFGRAPGFHARLDLPSGARDVPPELAAVLLAPTLDHEVERVAFVVYSPEPRQAAALAAVLVPAFVAEGVEVIGVLRADGGRWCEVPLSADGVESAARAYDARSHRFNAQAVVEGRVTHGSREELRATLAPVVERRARLSGLVAALPEPGLAEAIETCDLVDGWVASEVEPDDEGAARVLRSVTVLEARDAALYAVTRDDAPRHLRVWTWLLQGAADAQVPDVAAVTAFCAWLSGDGALAWCALDRCLAVDPRHTLGMCLAECLRQAVPPSVWAEVAGGRRSGTTVPNTA